MSNKKDMDINGLITLFLETEYYLGHKIQEKKKCLGLSTFLSNVIHVRNRGKPTFRAPFLFHLLESRSLYELCPGQSLYHTVGNRM